MRRRHELSDAQWELVQGHLPGKKSDDSNAIRARVKRMRAKACIRPNPRCKKKKRCDKRRCRNRNVVERFFRRIKECRRVATRYEKKAVNFAGFVWLAAFFTLLI